MPKNYNPKIPTQPTSCSKNIIHNRLSLHTTPTSTQLNANPPLILITSPKLLVNFHLPLHFNRQRGEDGEGYVKGTGTSLEGEASKAGLPASIRFQLV